MRAWFVIVFVVFFVVGDALATRRRQRNGRPPPWPIETACLANQAEVGQECLENIATVSALCCSGFCELRGATNVCCLEDGSACDAANDCCSQSCFAGACN